MTSAPSSIAVESGEERCAEAGGALHPKVDGRGDALIPGRMMKEFAMGMEVMRILAERVDIGSPPPEGYIDRAITRLTREVSEVARLKRQELAELERLKSAIRLRRDA